MRTILTTSLDRKKTKLAMRVLSISIIAQINIGCTPFSEMTSEQYSSSFRCLNLNRVIKREISIQISADVNYRHASQLSNTECRALTHSGFIKSRMNFILLNIDPNTIDQLAARCIRSSLVPIARIDIPINSLVDPSYSNNILIQKKCDIQKLLSNNELEISERDFNSIAYLQSAFAPYFIVDRQGSLNTNKNKSKFAHLPKFNYKNIHIPTISGEFSNVPIETSFYMGAIVNNESSEIYCGTINDLSSDDVPTLVDSLSACLFDLQYST